MEAALQIARARVIALRSCGLAVSSDDECCQPLSQQPDPPGLQRQQKRPKSDFRYALPHGQLAKPVSPRAIGVSLNIADLHGDRFHRREAAAVDEVLSQKDAEDVIRLVVATAGSLPAIEHSRSAAALGVVVRRSTSHSTGWRILTLNRRLMGSTPMANPPSQGNWAMDQTAYAEFFVPLERAAFPTFSKRRPIPISNKGGQPGYPGTRSNDRRCLGSSVVRPRALR